MGSELEPRNRNQHAARVLQASSLRDDITSLQQRVNATIGGGVATTLLFLGSGFFMEKTSTLWFLGLLWLAFGARLLVINRATRRQRQLKEIELARLSVPQIAPE